MTDEEYIEEANRIAHSACYDHANKLDINYKGLYVFNAEGHNGKVSGYPLFILAGANTVRRADIHETYDIMSMLTQECK